MGWNRGTLAKGCPNWPTGPIRDAFEQRGRKPTEARLPQLRNDISAIPTRKLRLTLASSAHDSTPVSVPPKCDVNSSRRKATVIPRYPLIQALPKHPIDGTTHGPRSAEATHHSMGLLAAVYSQYKPVERTLVA